jgi:hypothetical protein
MLREPVGPLHESAPPIRDGPDLVARTGAIAIGWTPNLVDGDGSEAESTSLTLRAPQSTAHHHRAHRSTMTRDSEQFPASHSLSPPVWAAKVLSISCASGPS